MARFCIEDPADHNFRCLERALIKSKIDEAFKRIDMTIQQLDKVANNAPDKVQAIADTAGFLFNSQDYPGIVSNLKNLIGTSSYSTRPSPSGDIDLTDKDILPKDAVNIDA